MTADKQQTEGAMVTEHQCGRDDEARAARERARQRWIEQDRLYHPEDYESPYAAPKGRRKRR